jgi:predicted dehydrogenase
MDKIRVAIVGTGGISRAHADAYRKAGGFEIVAVCDIFREKALQAAKEWGVPAKNAFTSYNKMLEMDGIDTVSVCTYNQAHRRPTVAALEAGKHVFCEKPMAATLADATAMVRAAKASGKILQIGIHSTFHPGVQFARKLVDAGVLGDIYYAETSGCRRRGIPGHTFIYKKTAGAGAVVDIGIYNMHNALYVMNYPKPARVSAITADYLAHQDPIWDKMDVEEFGAAWVRFDNGGVMLFKVSWAVHADSLGGTFFLGKKAGVSLGGPVLYADALTEPVKALAKTEGVTPEPNPPEGMTTVKFSGFPQVDVWEAQMKAFGAAVRTGAPSPIPPEGVLTTNVIMDGIFRSHASGREVAVQMPTL